VNTRAIEQRAARRKAIRTPKAAAIAGIIFALLLGASLILIWVAVPDESRRAGTSVLDDSSRRLVSISLNLLPFAGIAFLWFVGVVRDRIGENEDRFFATVFLGSGLLFVAMIFVAGALAGGLLATGNSGAAFPDVAVWGYGRRVTYSLITVYAMRMAGVFMISTTTLVMRLQIVPKWMAIYGFVSAVILLLTTAAIPYVALIFPLWVFVFSVHTLVITLRQRREQDEESAATAAVS
jgi:hypothetical protein